MKEIAFDGKTAVITGAASGMGLLTSRELVRLGATVVMCDVDGAALEKAVDVVANGGRGKVLPLVVDVRRYADAERAAALALEKTDRIDLVIPFAGGYEPRMCNSPVPFYEQPVDVLDWGIDVNLKAQFYFAHAVMKVMREQKSGLIVNIGSITGVEGDPRGMDYPTAKSGVMNGLTNSLAQYGAKYGVRCVCVSPGPVLTRPQMAKMQTLVGRAADPQEIVDFVLYIASDKGQFINGTNIMIDGGRSAMNRG